MAEDKEKELREEEADKVVGGGSTYEGLAASNLAQGVAYTERRRSIWEKTKKRN